MPATNRTAAEQKRPPRNLAFLPKDQYAAVKLATLRATLKVVESGCHEWQGPVKKSGYGNFTLNDNCMPVHRAHWILVRGSIPDGLFVCHTCDNRLCANLDHLWLGTPKQNTQDAIGKGRWDRDYRGLGVLSGKARRQKRSAA